MFAIIIQERTVSTDGIFETGAHKTQNNRFHTPRNEIIKIFIVNQLN